MSGAVIFVLAITAMMGFFGFAEFVAPTQGSHSVGPGNLHRMGFVIGFASRRQRWFL